MCITNTDLPTIDGRIQLPGPPTQAQGSLKRMRSKGDYGYMRRGSLVQLALRMRDLDDTLDDTLEDLQRLTSSTTSKSTGLQRSVSVGSDGHIQLDGLRRELENADNSTPLPDLDDIETGPSTSSEDESLSTSPSLDHDPPQQVVLDMAITDNNPMSPIPESYGPIMFPGETDESVKKLDLVEKDRKKLYDEAVMLRKESRNMRRLLLALVVVVLGLLFLRRGETRVRPSSCDQGTSEWTGLSTHVSVETNTLLELQSDEGSVLGGDMDSSLARGDFLPIVFDNIDIISTNQDKTQVAREVSEETTKEPANKLSRGALGRRETPPIMPVVRALKRIGRKLMGDTEAGGILDFKHNNVGVWAKSVAH